MFIIDDPMASVKKNLNYFYKICLIIFKKTDIHTTNFFERRIDERKVSLYNGIVLRYNVTRAFV